jgi:hypothetical protein
MRKSIWWLVAAAAAGAACAEPGVAPTTRRSMRITGGVPALVDTKTGELLPLLFSEGLRAPTWRPDQPR